MTPARIPDDQPRYIRESAAEIAYRLRNGIPPVRPVFIREVGR